MYSLANLMVNTLKNQGVRLEDEDRITQALEITLESADLLTPAVKKEIAFQAKQNEIELTSEEISEIAEKVVFTDDWSNFNETLMESISAFLERSN